MAVEHNFARGDILRKVLERTGIEAKRPLNLRRGALDQAHGAELLRKLRGFSQNARLLSSKLDDLIEFALPPGSKYPLPVLESAWKRWKKPSRKTFGQIMRRHDPRSPIPTMVFRDQPHMMAVRPSSPIAPSFHSGEYHDTPKWMNKDIKKSRNENRGLSARLDDLIQFKEKDESETLIKSRRAGTVGGATVGAYAGGLLGVEHGSLASGIQGAGEAAQKFKRYAKEDVSRAARKEAERYDVITDRYGAETKLLRDRRRVPPNVVPGPGAAKTGGVPFRETARSATERIGKVAKELPVRAKYAAEDVLHGAGKWLTRSSLSRSIAGGAVLGGVVGRHLGMKGGRQLEAAKARRSKELHKARIRRQATDIAKTHAQASAIIESMKKQNLLSAKLDDLIEFGILGDLSDAARAARSVASHDLATGRTLQYNKALEHWKNIYRKPASEQRALKKINAKSELSGRLDDLINFADPRPRNPQGEFSPQGEGGPDPNAMATVYKMPQQQQGMGVGRTAGAAIAGGALGATGGNIAKAGWTGVTEAIKKLAAKRKGAPKIIHP